MAVSALFVVAILTAVFVGINVGGSSTGVSFGPAVGADIISTRAASALMAVSALAGGILVGPNVIDTLGSGIVPGEFFTFGASIIILFFIGLNILAGNILGISASTSQIAVGAIVGMGAALNAVDWGLVGIILLWWLLSSVLVFWICVVVGKYFYTDIVRILDFDEEDLLPRLLILGVGCYMGFSAGASNVANAVAPLVGAGTLEMTPAVLLGGTAVAVGAFAIGPRIMRTIGNEITKLPLEAALIVEVISGTTITLLSWAGIPASLAVVTTLSIVGLGWGRAARDATVAEGIREAEGVELRSAEESAELFRIDTTRRAVSTWMVTPVLAGLLAFGVFEGGAFLGYF